MTPTNINTIKALVLAESEIDSLVETIIQDDNLIFEKNVEANIKKYKMKIINLLITSDYIELIPKLKKIYVNDTDTVNLIIESLISIVNELNFDSFKWIIINEPELFINFINKLSAQKFLVILNSIDFCELYGFIGKTKIFNDFKNLMVKFVDINLLCTNTSQMVFGSNSQFLKIFEKIIILIDVYIKKTPINTYFNNIHSKIMFLLLKTNTSLDTIIKYKKYYKISDENLKNYFEKNNILENFVRYSSVEIVTWFFEMTSVLTIIKQSNYKNIFKQACLNGNVELIKLIYNLIQCAGFKIDEFNLYSIMNDLIYQERWYGSNKTNYDNVIYEFINMGVKPPISATKYNEYYKNITIIKK
jgi:hypothetical protein